MFTIIFCFLATIDLTATIKVITTSPGTIPDDRDWDMIFESDQLSDIEKNEEEELEELLHPPLYNEGIRLDEEEPKRTEHLDLKYIREKEGPLLPEDMLKQRLQFKDGRYTLVDRPT